MTRCIFLFENYQNLLPSPKNSLCKSFFFQGSWTCLRIKHTSGIKGSFRLNVEFNFQKHTFSPRNPSLWAAFSPGVKNHFSTNWKQKHDLAGGTWLEAEGDWGIEEEKEPVNHKWDFSRRRAAGETQRRRGAGEEKWLIAAVGRGGGADVGVRESKPVMECHVSAASAAYASPPGCHDNQRILTCHFQSPPFLALPLLLTLTKRIINLLFVPDTKLCVGVSLKVFFLLSAFCYVSLSPPHTIANTPLTSTQNVSWLFSSLAEMRVKSPGRIQEVECWKREIIMLRV